MGSGPAPAVPPFGREAGENPQVRDSDRFVVSLAVSYPQEGPETQHGVSSAAEAIEQVKALVSEEETMHGVIWAVHDRLTGETKIVVP